MEGGNTYQHDLGKPPERDRKLWTRPIGGRWKQPRSPLYFDHFPESSRIRIPTKSLTNRWPNRSFPDYTHCYLPSLCRDSPNYDSFHTTRSRLMVAGKA